MSDGGHREVGCGRQESQRRDWYRTLLERKPKSCLEDKKKNETTTPLPPEESVCSPIRCLIGLHLCLFREWSRGA